MSQDDILQLSVTRLGVDKGCYNESVLACPDCQSHRIYQCGLEESGAGCQQSQEAAKAQCGQAIKRSQDKGARGMERLSFLVF